MDQLIELKEQEPSQVLLTRAEREELDRLDIRAESDWEQEDSAASVTRAGETGSSTCRAYKVNPGCQVGYFRLRSG
jgi:hypothetical protein